MIVLFVAILILIAFIMPYQTEKIILCFKLDLPLIFLYNLFIFIVFLSSFILIIKYLYIRFKEFKKTRSIVNNNDTNNKKIGGEEDVMDNNSSNNNNNPWSNTNDLQF